jgi:predicted dehydrogenase
MRSLGRLAMPGIEGRPSIVRAHAEQRTPEVDAWCDVELGFPGGATGLAAHSMVGDDYSFTIRIVGTIGDLLVHDFIKPNADDGLTITTAAGTTVERLGTRASYTYQLEAFAAHVEQGAPLPFGTADAVANMTFIDNAYRAAGMHPR